MELLATASSRLTDFLDGLPRPWSYFLLLLPLVLTISMVYKATKSDGPRVISEGMRMFSAITVVMGGIAVALLLVIRYAG